MAKKLSASEFDEAVKSALAGTPPPVAAVKRKDTKVGRFYEVPGLDEPLPSVTHILSVIAKPALINWAANQERTMVLEAAADLYEDIAGTPRMARPVYLTTLQRRLGKVKAHQRELAKAGEIGTQVHGLIEWEIRRSLGQKVGPEPRVTDKAQWAYMAFQDWAAQVGMKPIFIEQMIFSRKHGYAGTMDLLAEVEGIKTLVDFKTGKAVYGEAHLQNVAYQVALEEMGHQRAERGMILRLPKIESDPEFEAVECPSVDELFPTFLSAIALWKWWFAGEKAYRERQKAAAA